MQQSFSLQAKVSISTVQDAVSRLFTVRMKLGEFDPPDNNPYTKCVATIACQSKILPSL